MPDTLNIAALFPDCVATSCRRIGQSAIDLFPQEQEFIKKAVDKRRSEFAAGRACAREALCAIGFAPMPILQNDARAPLWPDGTLGAISHSHTWAGAAVTRSPDLCGIGLDIETIKRVNLDIARMVLTQQETNFYAALPDAEKKQYLALVFSAKEAVYKCLSPVSAIRIGFKDALVQQTDGHKFEVFMSGRIADALPACACMTGRFFLHEGSVFTGIVLGA
jgi:phosphopantetheine--protein transferase-like protein